MASDWISNLTGEGKGKDTTDWISMLTGEESEVSTIPTIDPKEEVKDISNQLKMDDIRERDPFAGTLQGDLITEYLTPSLEEVSWADESLFKATKNMLLNNAKELGVQALATSEAAMSLASGMLLFFPSKLYGIMALPFGREVANIAEEEMAKLGYQPHTDEGKAAMEIVGKGFEIFLSPARKLDEFVSKVSPRAGYLAGFGAELAEFALTGGAVRGAKAKFKPRLEQARKIIDAKKKLETQALTKKEKTISEIPDEQIKKAQLKVLEVEKRQTELEFQAMEESLIKEELGRQAEDVARIKQLEPIVEKESVEKLNQKEIERIFEEEKTPEIEPSKTPLVDTKIVEKNLDVTYQGKGIGGLHNWIDNKTKGNFSSKTLSELEVGESLLDVRKGFEEVKESITDLDTQTGTREPIQLSTENSPFRETSEHTQLMKNSYEQSRVVNEDVEIFTGKQINDVNRWLDGEDTVNIEGARDTLTNLATRADELRSEFMEGENYPSNFENWKEMVSEAAAWARKADRLKNEPSGIDLNIGIPLDKLPELVRDFVMLGKAFIGKTIRMSDMYRNRKIFDKTGFWLGKDEKWRYEIDDSKSEYHPSKAVRSAYNVGGFSAIPLTSVLTHPDLYKAVPEMRNILVKFDKNLQGRSGKYNPSTKTISIKRIDAKKVLFHEVQHAVNEITGSKFWGSNIEHSGANLRTNILISRMEEGVKNYKNPEVIEYINGLIKEIKNRINEGVSVTNIPKFIQSEVAKYIETTEGMEAANKLRFPIKPSPFAIEREYYIDPGEMEARLATRRLDMTKKERAEEPPWETLEDMLHEEGFTTYPEMEPGTLKTSTGTKLYSGIPIDKVWELIKNIKKIKKPTDIKKARISRDIKEGKESELIKEIRKDLKDFGYDNTDKYMSEPTTLYANHEKLNTGFTKDEIKLGYYAFSKYEGKTVPDNIIEIVNGIKKGSIKIARHLVDTELSKDDIIQTAWNLTFADPAVGANWAIDRVNKYLNKDPGTKLYDIGGATAEAAKEIVSSAKQVRDYVIAARGFKKFKPKVAAKTIRDEFVHSFVDKSGNIRRELLDKLGDEGYRIVQKMYLSKGASSLAANNLNQMRKEVYRGLSSNEKRIMDTLILAERMVDIGNYKTSKEFKFPKGLEPTSSVAYMELFEQIEKLSPKRAVEIRDRVKAHFDWMKKPLKDMLDAELISEKEYNDLINHNYRRIKLVEVFDKRQPKMGKKKRSVYDSGIESLARGRNTDIFEPSSEIMALEVFNRSYGRILNQAANKELLDLAKRDPENPFVRVKTKGKPIPSGWSRIFVYEKGERKSVYLNPEMSKEWITSNPEMSYKLSQLIRYTSGSPVLRTFATGINWGFAVANLPRDVLHTWFTARVFENGKWKNVYNSTAPVFAMQIGRDLKNVFTDAATKGPKYKQYIEEGGGMEFLVHQGRLFQRGRHLEGPIDKIYDFLGYFGETSEIMTRLAIRERVIRRRAKEQNISMEEARKNKDITQEATFAARDYMDFGQGGGIAKALDNGVPYLNAAIQGTRGLWRSFKDNKVASAWKMTQFAALTTGMAIAAWKLAPLSKKALQGNVDEQNNLVIPLGDSFGFEDKEGQIRYPYLKIPLDPGQKFFKTFFEAAANKWLGKEIDINQIVDSLKEQSPVGVTEMPPTVSAAIGYMTNKDFWLNEDIWRKTDKPFSWPESKKETIPGQTGQVYTDIGQVTGLSPERLQFAIEELVTSGTVWSYLLGKGYEELLGNLPESKKQQHLAMTLARIPVIKRFFGVTHPYSQSASDVEKAKEKDDIERWVQNSGLDMRMDGYFYEKNVERKEVFDYMSSFKDRKIYDRLKDRFEFEEKIQDLPNKSLWRRMRGLTVKARAEVFVKRLKSSSLDERAQLWEEYGIAAKAGGIVSEEFRQEVYRLREREVE
uniref:Uncharacterized protein n=1 Tax=viral metagenome TaxID=1070528 RepID=A0A6M3KFS6_9ZZZZ